MSSSVPYRWWRDAPRFARRFYWRFIVVISVVAAIFALTLVIAGAGGMTPAIFVGFSFVPGAIVFLCGLTLSRWETRLVERLRAADCKLCPRCGRALSIHDGSTDCSQCATALDLEEVKTLWQAYRPVTRRAPTMILRRRLVLAVSGLVVVGAMMIVMMLPFVAPEVALGSLFLPWWVLAALAPFGALGALLVWVLIRERRLRNKAREHEGYLCPQCAYPIPRTEKDVRCPECGTRIDVDRVVTQWREFVAPHS